MKTQQNHKMSMLKWLAFALAFTLLVAENQAQVTDTTPSFCRHEFSVWSSFGASTLHYKPVVGTRETGLGGAFGLGYVHFFNPNWGFRTGAEIAVYNTLFHLRKLVDMYTRQGFDDLTPGWTGADEIIDYHTEISNFTEIQRLFSVNIPLMVQFQTPLAGGNHQFFVSAGAKIGIPINSTFMVQNASLYTWYFDHKTRQEFRPDPTDYGMPYLEDLGVFYNLPFATHRLENPLRISGKAAIETGVKFHVNPRLSLYVGAFANYGLTDSRRQSGQRFFEFDPEMVDMVASSVLNAQFANAYRSETNFTDRVSPLSFGLTVRMGINLCQNSRRATRQNSSSHVINIYQHFYYFGNPSATPQMPDSYSPGEYIPEQPVMRKTSSDTLTLIPLRRKAVNEETLENEPITKKSAQNIDNSKKSCIFAEYFSSKHNLSYGHSIQSQTGHKALQASQKVPLLRPQQMCVGLRQSCHQHLSLLG